MAVLIAKRLPHSLSMPYKDPERWNLFNRRRYAENKREFDEWKELTPCADCGGTYPHYVMELDHVPERGPKRYNVQRVVGTRSMRATSLQTEMAKCDLVCANCHKIRTHKRSIAADPEISEVS